MQGIRVAVGTGIVIVVAAIPVACSSLPTAGPEGEAAPTNPPALGTVPQPSPSPAATPGEEVTLFDFEGNADPVTRTIAVRILKHEKQLQCTAYFQANGITFIGGANTKNQWFYDNCTVFLPTTGVQTSPKSITWTTTLQTTLFRQTWLCKGPTGPNYTYFPINCTWNPSTPPPPADAGSDAASDAAIDAAIDASFDSGVDSGFDAGFDAASDAGSDATSASDASLVYGNQTGQVYFHTCGASFASNQLSGSVTAINLTTKNIANMKAVIDSTSSTGILLASGPGAGSTSGVIASYGTVAPNSMNCTSPLTWVFDVPGGASFTFIGHATGTPQ